LPTEHLEHTEKNIRSIFGHKKAWKIPGYESSFYAFIGAREIQAEAGEILCLFTAKKSEA